MRESGLGFIIARPTRLTNGKAAGQYTRVVEPVPGSVSRADLTNFLVESCYSPAFVG